MSAIKLVKRMTKSKSKFTQQLYHKLVRFIYACDFSPKCKIGGGIVLNHNGLGCVLYAKQIGDNTSIFQNVTFGYSQGGNREKSAGCPTIGKNCRIYCGAVIIGNITIGDNTIVAANAVVTESTPPHSIVGGIPAKVIKIMDENHPRYKE